MHTGTHWAEIRSSHNGLLADLPGAALEPGRGEPREEAVMSVVVDSSGRRLRALPGLFLGPQLVFAHREIHRVVEETGRWADAIGASAERSIYTLRACRIGERVGLYGRDMFAGSPFRRRLQRLGFRFDAGPFVTYDEDGSFHSPDLGVVPPDFMILGGNEDDDGEIMTTSGAMLPFVTVTYRLGLVGAVELKRLVGTLQGVPAVSAAHPQHLFDFLAA